MHMILIRLAPAIAAVVFGVLLAFAPARASVLMELSLEELTVEADRIMVGRVVWSEPIRRGDGMIRTRYRVEVERELRGSDDKEIIVETLGGKMGRLGMRVAGAPSFALGDRALIFLREGAEATFRPIGMSQGVMRIEREDGQDIVVPSRRGMLLVRSDARGVLEKSGGPLADKERLDAFISRIQTILEAQRRVAP